MVKATKMADNEQMAMFDILLSTKRRLLEGREMCYVECVKELKRLVFGCQVGKDGRWRAVDDWLKGGVTQQQLMSTLEALESLGSEAKARADTELMASLRPSLHGLISLLVEREERRQSADPREGGAKELIEAVLDHIRRVMRLQLILTNTLHVQVTLNP